MLSPAPPTAVFCRWTRTMRKLILVFTIQTSPLRTGNIPTEFQVDGHSFQVLVLEFQALYWNSYFVIGEPPLSLGALHTNVIRLSDSTLITHKFRGAVFGGGWGIITIMCALPNIRLTATASIIPTSPVQNMFIWDIFTANNVIVTPVVR